MSVHLKNVHFRNVVANVIAAGYVLPVNVRVRLMRFAGISVGDRTTVKSRCTFAGPGPVVLGAGCYISFQCVFDATGEIVVGDNVYIASGVSVGTCTHDIGDAVRRAGPQYPHGVSIGSGTWVGMNVAILPGARIGPGCVIAAGAVVTGTCEANGLYGGVPAKLLQSLDPAPDSAIVQHA